MSRYTAPHGWDGSDWRKLPMLWGYSDVYGEREQWLNVEAGDRILTFSVVPAGEIWIIHHVNANAVFATPGFIGLQAYVGGEEIVLEMDLLLFSYSSVRWTGHIVLKEDDYLRAVFWECAAGDDINAHAAGYKMKVME